MLLNTKCERCNEPTKHVVGFWDGENGKSGFVHDCENEKCEVRQLIKVTETKAMQERFRIQNLNSRKRMYAGYIAALRKDAKISMMEMSKIAGCSPAEYSAYEHERNQRKPKSRRIWNILTDTKGSCISNAINAERKKDSVQKKKSSPINVNVAKKRNW